MEAFEIEQLEKLLKDQEYDKVIHYVDLLRSPEPGHLGYKAAALNNLRHYYEALDLLESIAPEHRDYKWHYRYGYSLCCVERFKEGVDHLWESVKLKDDFPDVWLTLYLLYSDDVVAHSPRQLKQIEEKLASFSRQQLPELLQNTHFISGQEFSRDHQILFDLQVDRQSVKNRFIEIYRQKIDLLEHQAYGNEDVKRIFLDLIFEVYDLIHAEFEKTGRNFREALYNEMVYICYWFGLEDQLTDYVLTVANYALEAEDAPLAIDPRDFALLLDFAGKDQHQKIADFYYALPESKKTYNYASWVIKASLQLKEYQLALSHLEHFKEEGQTDELWHIWYTLAMANLGEFKEAELHAKQALSLNPNNLDTWQLLEDIYLNGLDDIKQANQVRERKEELMEEMGMDLIDDLENEEGLDALTDQITAEDWGEEDDAFKDFFAHIRDKYQLDDRETDLNLGELEDMVQDSMDFFQNISGPGKADPASSPDDSLQKGRAQISAKDLSQDKLQTMGAGLVGSAKFLKFLDEIEDTTRALEEEYQSIEDLAEELVEKMLDLEEDEEANEEALEEIAEQLDKLFERRAEIEDELSELEDRLDALGDDISALEDQLDEQDEDDLE